MTMVERIEVMEEIEKANKRNIRRMKVKALYIKFCREGKFEQARRVLRFLRHGKITLCLDDVDCDVEIALGDIGCHVGYSRNYNSAFVSM